MVIKFYPRPIILSICLTPDWGFFIISPVGTISDDGDLPGRIGQSLVQMVKFLRESLIILLASVCLSATFHLIQGNPPPVFKTYVPSEPSSGTSVLDPLAAEIDEVDAYVVQSLLAGDSCVLIDARKDEDYANGFIPGALSLPLDRFDEIYPTLADRLTRSDIVVVYCIDRSCLDSTMLGVELVKKGHENVLIYKDGIADWKSRGLPLDRSDGK